MLTRLTTYNLPQAFLLLFVVAGFISCGGPSEIKFGAILDESGDAAEYGRSIRNGIELAVEHVNARGVKGFDQVPVKVVFRDSKLDIETAQAAFIELIDTEDSLAVIGAAASSITLELCDLAETKERVLLSPASSSPQITQCGGFVFRNYPSDVLEAGKLADFARKRIFVKRISVIAVRNSYGVGLKTEFVKSFKGLGGEVLKIVNYPETETDFADEIAEAVESKPQAVYLVGYTEHLKGLVRAIAALKPLDPDGRPVRVLSCGAFDSAQIMEEACDAAKGVFFPRPLFDLDDSDGMVQSFVTAYRERYQMAPDTFAAHGYDALMMLVDAVESRKSVFPAELQFHLATLQNWKGVTGKTTIDQNGDVSTRFPRILVVDDECRFEDFDKLTARRSESSN